MEYQYLGTGAAEGMPATFCACPVCLRSMREGGKSLRMRACTLLGDDVLIDLSPDIHAQKLRFGLRIASNASSLPIRIRIIRIYTRFKTAARRPARFVRVCRRKKTCWIYTAICG